LHGFLVRPDTVTGSLGKCRGRVARPGRWAGLDFSVYCAILTAFTEPLGKENLIMETKKFVFYQEDDMWIGWLEEYPDYRTQGATLEELKENLKDIYEDLTGGVPGALSLRKS
jgi:hypothetical protein